MNVPFLNLKKQYESLLPEIEQELKKVFESCAFIGGAKVAEFEKSMCEYLNVKYAIGLNSGTDALVLALRAVGVKPGDEVITTAFSFFATAEAIAIIGAVPVFVDVNESDYNMDVSKIEEAISTKTKAILPVQMFGAPCDMDAIMDIAKRHSLKVIEDDAQAIGSSYKGRRTGTLADIGCFSFYPTKNLGGAGDGGMITTNDDKLFTVVKALHEHGAGVDGAKAAEILGLEAAGEAISSDEKVTDLYNPYKYFNYIIGYNSRLDALQAAVLLVKMKRLDGYNKRRTEIAARYRKGLTDKVMLPVYSSDIVPCYHQFVIRTDEKNGLCAHLGEQGVGCGTFYPVPLHRQKAFNALNSRISGGDTLHVAEKICSQTVCLPIFPEMADEETDFVISKVNDFFA